MLVATDVAARGLDIPNVDLVNTYVIYDYNKLFYHLCCVPRFYYLKLNKNSVLEECYTIE